MFGLGGLSNIQESVDIRPNSFSLSMKVPEVYFNGEQLQHESSLESGLRHFYIGAHITLKNAGFAIAGDYNLTSKGLQVSNVGLTLIMGELSLYVPEYFTTLNGQQSPIEEYKVDVAPQIMAQWREEGFERRYEEKIQNAINSYLVRCF